MSSISPRPSRRFDERADHLDDVLLAEDADGVLGLELEAHVHLDAADRGEVIALAVEEQRLEHGFGGLDRRRLARTHHAVDVEERVLAGLVLVDDERVADVGANRDVVDVEDRQLVETRVHQGDEVALGLTALGIDRVLELVAGLDVDLAGLEVDDVLGNEHAVEILVRSRRGA